MIGRCWCAAVACSASVQHRKANNFRSFVFRSRGSHRVLRTASWRQNQQRLNNSGISRRARTLALACSRLSTTASVTGDGQSVGHLVCPVSVGRRQLNAGATKKVNNKSKPCQNVLFYCGFLDSIRHASILAFEPCWLSRTLSFVRIPAVSLLLVNFHRPAGLGWVLSVGRSPGSFPGNGICIMC